MYSQTWSHAAEQPQAKDRDPPHVDWVRDVAWCPSTLPVNTIASAGEDKQVYIYTQDPESKQWSAPLRLGSGFDAPVWRVSWSVAGGVLAVSSGDHAVSLWKEELKPDADGGTQWVRISDVAEDGSLSA